MACGFVFEIYLKNGEKLRLLSGKINYIYVYIDIIYYSIDKI